tara:strand:- start:1352 stop:1714 length:363 start_codon:yes stop_codon:yes gene_type:complete
MADHNELGIQGEQLVTEHLMARGYKIRDRNWRFGKDEIDIITIDGDEILFVEVKTRNSDFFGNPAEAVTRSKQAQLIKAANAYVEKHDLDLEVRFDVIGIIFNQEEQKMDRIEGAFIPRW